MHVEIWPAGIFGFVVFSKETFPRWEGKLVSCAKHESYICLKHKKDLLLQAGCEEQWTSWCWEFKSVETLDQLPFWLNLARHRIMPIAVSYSHSTSGFCFFSQCQREILVVWFHGKTSVVYCSWSQHNNGGTFFVRQTATETKKRALCLCANFAFSELLVCVLVCRPQVFTKDSDKKIQHFQHQQQQCGRGSVEQDNYGKDRATELHKIRTLTFGPTLHNSHRMFLAAAFLQKKNIQTKRANFSDTLCKSAGRNRWSRNIVEKVEFWVTIRKT